MDEQRELQIQQIPEPTGSEAEPLKIVFGETRYNPKYESSIPTDITSEILQREKLPSELPPLGSSMIEDFIIGKIKQGLASPEQIADAFLAEGITDKVNQYIETVRARSEALDWDRFFTVADARRVQARVCREMEAMGMTPEQVAIIADMGVDITEGIGVSSLTHEAVYTSRLQAVRRAMDYTKVFGNDVPFEQVLKALMTSTIGHELGHKIDEVVGIAISRIPMDKSWEKDGDTHENKSERFAEFWGSIGDAQSNQIQQREWLIHLEKVTEMWETLRVYNATHKEKADLMAIFRAIDEKSTVKNSDMGALLLARRLLYCVNEVENYASPYSRDVVASAVKPKS